MLVRVIILDRPISSIFMPELLLKDLAAGLSDHIPAVPGRQGAQPVRCPLRSTQQVYSDCFTR